MHSTAKQRVKSANSVSATMFNHSDLLEEADPIYIHKSPNCSQSFRLRLVKSPQLTDSVKQWALDLTETNMRTMYEQSNWGWDGKEKESELTAHTSKLILVEKLESCRIVPADTAPADTPPADTAPADTAPADTAPADTPPALSNLAAFCHYRLCLDNNRPVVYCYELQVAKSYQRCGIGKSILHMMELIGLRAGMLYSMATVFKFNSSSLHFFTNQSYSTDQGTVMDGGEDYEILIKKLQS